mgnify:CR=1 FL=1
MTAILEPQAPDKPSSITSGLDPRFKPRLYEHIGSDGSWTLPFALKHGAYEGAKKALAGTPESVQDEVKKAGLRGRGGGVTGLRGGGSAATGGEHACRRKRGGQDEQWSLHCAPS